MGWLIENWLMLFFCSLGASLMVWRQYHQCLYLQGKCKNPGLWFKPGERPKSPLFQPKNLTLPKLEEFFKQQFYTTILAAVFWLVMGLVVGLVSLTQ